MIEYRICWSASSNISFNDATDWEPWEDQEMTERQIEDELCRSDGTLADGLEQALAASGFEWWVETRQA